MSTARTLQRVVLPLEGNADALPLYAEIRRQVAAENSSPEPTLSTLDQDQVLDRRRLRFTAGSRVSFATYFNAFPAAYWQRWTTMETIELVVRLSGPGRVAVYRSGASANTERVATGRYDRPDQCELVFPLPLKRFMDGGWYWFEVQAGPDEVVLEAAEWRTGKDAAAPPAGVTEGTVTLGVTTFNRPTYLLDLLRQVSGSPDLLAIVDEVVVVDQGTQRVRDETGFDEAEAALGGRLRVIEQANIGGSGGFARGMYETLATGRSRYVLVMDDDIALEPESILRAVAFADRCRRPTLVGGHMFNLYSPTRLHHFGEVVKSWRFHWTPAAGTKADHDFETHSLRSTPWMHRRVDVDYNAWWMCLIPVEVLEKVGLALPIFIKWDDAEYGLRAKKAGFQTVTLPGVAVWHMPFSEKDDVTDWQAYFHQRNRFVAALLHSSYPHGGRLVRDSLYQQVRHLLALQYSVVDLRLRALEDVLAGPEGLHAQLATKLPEVRAARRGYPDADTVTDPEAFPSVRRPDDKGKTGEPPQSRMANLLAAATIGLQQLRRVPREALDRPQIALSARETHWWRLAQVDSALVSTLDGTSVAWYRRDRTRYVALLRRSAKLHERMWAEWPELSRRYQQAAPDLVSAQTWGRTFEQLAREGR